MITLVYSRQDRKKIVKLLSFESSTYDDIRVCYRPDQIHELLANSRKNISQLVIEKGMPETSVMKGECRENSPQIPLRTIHKGKLGPL